MMNAGRFRIVGGTDAGDISPWPNREDIRREAERRIALLRLQQHQARAAATHGRLPDALRYLALQIDFVAEALAGLTQIPEDFQSDAYWPSFAGETERS